MELYQMMMIINELKEHNIQHLNKRDVKYYFDNADENTAECLEYLGCKVERVADLLNVTLPKKKFTKKAIKQELQNYRNLIMYMV